MSKLLSIKMEDAAEFLNQWAHPGHEFYIAESELASNKDMTIDCNNEVCDTVKEIRCKDGNNIICSLEILFINGIKVYKLMQPVGYITGNELLTFILASGMNISKGQLDYFLKQQRIIQMKEMIKEAKLQIDALLDKGDIASLSNAEKIIFDIRNSLCLYN